MKGINIINLIMAAEVMSNPGKMSGPTPISERVNAAKTKGQMKVFKVMKGHNIFSHNTETGKTTVERFEEYKGDIYITGRPPYIYVSSINMANAERKFKKIMQDNDFNVKSNTHV